MLIETPRLLIRYFKIEDVDLLFEVFSDPDVMRFSIKGPLTKFETQQFINRCIEAYPNLGYSQYAVVLKESNMLIGHCGFFDQTIDNHVEVELGYRYAKLYWGKGLATEAACACRDYGFSQRLFKRIISIIEPDNIASIRVAEKAGLTFEKKSLFHGTSVNIFAMQNQPN
jgi:[ribosomal protein S5]-alanine N-acetyltransferase